MARYSNAVASSRGMSVPRAANSSGPPIRLISSQITSHPKLGAEQRSRAYAGSGPKHYEARSRPAPIITNKQITDMYNGKTSIPGVSRSVQNNVAAAKRGLKELGAQALTQLAYAAFAGSAPGLSIGLRRDAVWDPVTGWGVRAYHQRAVISVPAPPPSPSSINFILGATRNPVFRSVTPDRWIWAYGVTDAYVAPNSGSIWTAYPEVRLAPVPLKVPFVPYYPVPDPEPVVAPRAVNRPATQFLPLPVGLRTNGNRASVTQRGRDYPDKLEYGDAKWRSKPLMMLMGALEGAGDAGELLAVFYQAARREAFKEGIRMPSWGQSGWGTRIRGIEMGLTLGVDYASLAEGVGKFWVDEVIGSRLQPTSRTPGSGVSNNVRLHRPANAMRDMMI